MKNVDKLKKQLDAVKAEIENLSVFRDTLFVRKFRRQLEGEQSFIKNKISDLSRNKEAKELQKDVLRSIANNNRSAKMKRTWRFIKAIKKNYSIDLSSKELRTALKKHRQGLETDVPDVAWRNPSP